MLIWTSCKCGPQARPLQRGQLEQPEEQPDRRRVRRTVRLPVAREGQGQREQQPRVPPESDVQR